MADSSIDFQLPIGNPFPSWIGGYGIAEANTYVSGLSDQVREMIESAIANADRIRESAQDVISGLQDVHTNVQLEPAPLAPELTLPTLPSTSLGHVNVTDFGVVNPQLPDEPVFSPVRALNPIDLPTFTSEVGPLVMPTAPDIPAIDAPPPEPTLETILIPLPPELIVPDAPQLLDINLDTIGDLVLPSLDVETPAFTGTPIHSVFNWAEPSYHEVILDETIAVIRRMWDGELGLPVDVENAIFERAVERIDRSQRRDIASALTEFSSRGYSRPNGVMTAHLEALAHQAELQKSEVLSNTTIEVAKIHIENVRDAVSKAIAVEELYMRLFENATNRVFMAQKTQLETEVAAYNATVQLYNAQVAILEAKVAAYRAEVEGAVSEYRAKLEFAQASSSLNEQKVRIFSEYVGVLKVRADLYQSEVQSGIAQIQAQQSKIDQYRATIAAYAERLNAAKIPFELYSVQVNAEQTKAQIRDAETRAYAALLSGKSTEADIQAKQVEVDLQMNNLKIDQYRATLEGAKLRMDSQIASIQASVAAYEADTKRVGMEADVATSYNEASVRTTVANLQAVIAKYEADIKLYDTKSSLLLKQADQMVAALEATGRVAATLAAGAMSGVNIGASISGSGQISGSGSSGYNQSVSYSQQVSEARSQSENISRSQ